MGFSNIVGKYQVGRTIGEGNFAKVKLAVNMRTHQSVAIKIINKQMVMEHNLMEQVKKEISVMRLLQHPNIVKIYEVIGTKTKIYIVMEYVSGGQLSDKLAYTKRLGEEEARKYFHQLIDAIDYCHGKGVYHRDLKPENLLLDSRGNLKVTDFGLSTLQKPGELLYTACGSPSYVAPEVLSQKRYDGAAADIWSCGVILFELLAGHLPFDDPNLLNLYKKISRAEYTCPKWFTASQMKLIFKILDPMPSRRMKVADILEDGWFRIDYKPCNHTASELDRKINLEDKHTASDNTGNITDVKKSQSASLINAFQLIAMSNYLDLSGLFEEQVEERQKIKLGSEHPITETIEKIEFAAKELSLSVERMNNFKVKLLQKNKLSRCSRSNFNLLVEVTEVTPTNCVVEISSSAGEMDIYKEFCKSLSSVLKEKTSESKPSTPQQEQSSMKDIQEYGCHEAREKSEQIANAIVHIHPFTTNHS
ncbi:hypothetical protein Syun_024956 [Stephania yunnanensis]|uniref:non-specific serine/threonine protein kinase n=1 Tax=Stephania yunnanensis TaxID=152371 RepID=A0AAP0EQR4_9MAGN